MTCNLCRSTTGRGPCVFQTPVNPAKEEGMREYRVRVYDDHYLVTDAEIGVGTFVAAKGELEEKLNAGEDKTVATVPKKPRRKRGPNKPKGTPKERAPAEA